MKRDWTKKERIIELLKAGEMITCRSSGHPTYALNYRVTNGDSSLLVHHQTVQALIRNKIISGPSSDPSKKYKLL